MPAPIGVRHGAYDFSRDFLLSQTWEYIHPELGIQFCWTYFRTWTDDFLPLPSFEGDLSLGIGHYRTVYRCWTLRLTEANVRRFVFGSVYEFEKQTEEAFGKRSRYTSWQVKYAP